MDTPAFEIVGIGVSTVDVLALVEHFPSGEEVQQAFELEVQGGGPVATALVAAARLGARTAMLDSLGDDWRARQILEQFVQAGVSVEHIRQHPDASSATACVLVRRGGERTIIHKPGSAPQLEPADLPRGLIERAGILHLNGRHPRAALAAAGWAKAAGVKVSFDGGAHHFRPELQAFVPLADYCIVARHFAEQATGQADPRAAAEALLAHGPALAVVTDGARGSLVASRDGTLFHQPALRVHEVVDTTGCGDSYHGAFLFGLARGYSLREAAALASAVAALNARHLGGRAGLPTLEQARAFLRDTGHTPA